MTEQNVPVSRTYRHIQCGNETNVEGQSFEIVSNPMSSMEQTQCASCGKMFPITDFEWVDTKETIADYYARHTTTATNMQRFLCSKKFMVGLIVLFAALAAAGAYAVVANDDWMTRAICLGGGLLVGAMIGMSIFLRAFANPITRKVCGVSDTRLLT